MSFFLFCCMVRCLKCSPSSLFCFVSHVLKAVSLAALYRSHSSFASAFTADAAGWSWMWVSRLGVFPSACSIVWK